MHEVGDGFGIPPAENGFDGALYPGFKTLFQGDHLGVEFALEAHQELLYRGGLLKDEQRVRANAPFPLTSCWEGLIIDDYFCIGAEPFPLGDGSFASSMLEKARQTYEEYMLPGSPEKDIVAQPRLKAAGAEVNSLPSSVRNGYVTIGAPAEKRLSLACLSLRLARLPCCSAILASRLSGNWTSVLMFRRCMSSIVTELFALGALAEEGEPNTLLPLSRTISDELALLACLSPFMVTDASAAFIEEIYATDASLNAGAIVRMPVDEHLSKLLWLCGDKRGSYTMLESGFKEALRWLGEHDEEELDFEVEKVSMSGPSKAPMLYYDFIEFYGGAGGVSKHLASMGFTVAPPLDLSRSRHYNMSDLRLLEWALAMLESGRIYAFMTGPPCTTFSAAAHPCCRSYDQPLGYDRCDEKTLEGNLHSFRSFILMKASVRLRRPSLLEQPFLSKMAWTFGWKSLLQNGCREAYVASCQFGSPHKKFRLLCHLLDVQSLTVRCGGGHKHIPIAGALTRPSAVHVDGLARHIAEHFKAAILLSKRREAQFGDSSGLESVVLNDLLVAGTWQLERSWQWKRQGHINVLEAATIVSLLQQLGVGRQDSRFTILSDSRVARGALAKGRSSSRALAPLCRRAAAIQVGCGLQPSFDFAPTRINIADNPSRFKEIEEPLKLAFGEKFSTEELQLPHTVRVRRWLAGWIRLIILSTLVR